MENQGAYYIAVGAGDWGLLDSIRAHCVTIGWSLNLSVPQFPQIRNDCNTILTLKERCEIPVLNLLSQRIKNSLLINRFKISARY